MQRKYEGAHTGKNVKYRRSAVYVRREILELYFKDLYIPLRINWLNEIKITTLFKYS